MNKTILIVVVVVVALYFFNKKSATAPRPPAPRAPTGTSGGFTQGLENAAPALGKFLGGLFSSGGGGGGGSSSSSAFSADFHDGVWDPSGGSAAFGDDSSFEGFDSV